MAPKDPEYYRKLKPYSIEPIPVDELVVWRNGLYPDGYQRHRGVRWVAKRAKAFREDMMRPLEVNIRETGMFAVMDGGGRLEIAKAVGWDEIQCRLHDRLSIEQEAGFFAYMNNRRNTVTTSAVEQFLAEYVEGVENVVSIHDALAASGFKIAEGQGNNVIQAVEVVRSIHRKHGPAQLTAICSVIKAAWPGDPKASHSTVIQALDHLLWEFKGQIDVNRLIDKVLEISDHRKDRDLSAARYLSGETSGTGFPKGMALSRLWWDKYNKTIGRRANRLPITPYEPGNQEQDNEPGDAV